jgi:integrase
MPKTNKLSARKVITAAVGWHGDGGGLWLRVRPNGSRAWCFRYTRNGARREMGLGALETVSLSEARDLARTARKQLRAGLDPIREHRLSKKAVPLFRDAADAFMESHSAGWSNPKHAQQWKNTLATYAEPVIGDLPVDQVDTEHVMQILAPIWREKPETASRVRGRLERVLDWSAVQGHRSKENPARWRGHLDALLPARSKVRAVRHHAAMPWQEVPAFMVRLRDRTGAAARALELAILTAARSGEVRGATWTEIDLEGRTWTVPAERMKGGREHRVPLSEAAASLLEGLPWRGTSELLFPSPLTDNPLSDAALCKVLKDMGDPFTAHGFRSSFRDWCAESTNYPREVAEQALAHAISNHVEAAYRRGDLLTKRQLLMDEWARFCETPQAAKATVVPIRREAGCD